MVDGQLQFGLGPKMKPGPFSVNFWIMPERREKVLKLPLGCLLAIASGRVEVYLPKEIPEDAVTMRIFEDILTNSICLVLAHPSFENVPEGCVVPQYSAEVIYHGPLAINKKDEYIYHGSEESLEREV
jgi:hypothetical protein